MKRPVGSGHLTEKDAANGSVANDSYKYMRRKGCRTC